MDLINLIAGGVIGVICSGIWSIIKGFFAGRKGELSGSWHQIIPRQDNEPEKLDLVRCKHTNSRVYGTITRLNPSNQVEKEWEFEAKLRNDLFFGVFWPKDSSINPGSYGTLQLQIINVNSLKGFYVKHLKVAAETKNQVNAELKPIQFEWEKLPRKKRVLY